MKRVLTVLFAILITFSIVGCGKAKNNDNNNNNGTIEDQVKNETDEKQGDLVFKNIKIESLGATNTINGTVQNIGKEAKTFKATLLMYKDNSTQILGKVSKMIENLAPNETRSFEISIMGDYSTVNKFEVKVE